MGSLGEIINEKHQKAKVNVSDVLAARQRIAAFVSASPLVPFNIPTRDGIKVYLKLENLSPVGSFKLRGAANTLLSISREELSQGVHTVSTGNFGHAVAWMARELGIPCTVIVPDHVPETKMAGALRHGASVHRVPWDEWWQYIDGTRTPDHPGKLIHPEGHDEILAGTGTIALEILDQLPHVDTVLIPYGGGGMTAGMGTVLKDLKPNINVYACEVDTAAPLRAALDKGHPVPVKFNHSFVDGIGSNCVLAHVWDVVKTVVDDSFVVDINQVKEAVKQLAQRQHIIAEGAGAATTAAVMAGKLPETVKNVVCVVSGGNIDHDTLIDILKN